MSTQHILLPSALGPEPRLVHQECLLQSSGTQSMFIAMNQLLEHTFDNQMATPSRATPMGLGLSMWRAMRLNIRLSFILVGLRVLSGTVSHQTPRSRAFECFDTASRACCCLTASERFHQHLRVSGTKSVARILPCGLREHPACRRLENRRQHKRLSGPHQSR